MSVKQENAPDPAKVIPAEPSSEPKQPDPSTQKSDIERLRESKEKHKQAAIEAQKRADELEAKLKAKEDAELESQKKFEELADKRKAEAEAAKAEAEAAKAEKAAADAKLAEYEAEKEKASQEREVKLTERLNAIPEEDRPPISDDMSIDQRESMIAWTEQQLQKKTKHGGLPPPSGSPSDAARLAELKAKPLRTPQEKMEMLSLSAKE